MSVDFVAASSQRLSVSDTPFAAYPFSLFCRCRPDSLQTAVPFGLGSTSNDGVTTSEYAFIAMISDGTIRAQIDGSGGFEDAKSAATSATYSAGSWLTALAVFTSATSRTIYLNGVNAVTNSDSVTFPSLLNSVSAGAYLGASWLLHFDGLVADCVVWNAALTAGEAAALNAVSPRLVRPQSLVRNWGLESDSGYRCRVSNKHMSQTNSPAYAQHPGGIVYPIGAL